MRRRKLATSAVIAAAVFAAALLLYAVGALNRAEHAISDLRFAALESTVDSDIVIVGIDAHSLEALGVWPWPRQHHAVLLQQLARSTPAQVFFDIDFSSAASDPRGDDFFESALGSWSGGPVLLAAHLQADRGSTGESVARRPLQRFRQHVDEVSVMLAPDPDGLVRSMLPSAHIDGIDIPSAFARGHGLAADRRVPIDYSIDPASFDYVSYSDLLSGTIDPAALAGKTIYIGATSFELGDAVAVPRHRSLPGVVVQALAAETVRSGLPRTVAGWPLGLALALWTACWCLLFARASWRRNIVLTGAGIVLLFAAVLTLFGFWRIEFAAAPFAFALLAGFVVTSLRQLDDQTWQALAYALGVRRREALLRSVVETSLDAIIGLASDGTVRTANPAASVLFTVPLRRLIGRPITDFVPDFGQPADRAGGAGLPREFRAVDSGGRSVPVEATVSRVAVDSGELFTVIIRDISERKAQQDKLEHQATHDALTQLPNRTAVTHYLESLLDSAAAPQRVAVLLLDLCRFKEVNDTLGHSFGDEVLRVVSRRFSEALTERSFIGRIGGDEFAVIVPGVRHRPAIEQLAQSLVESLKMPIQVSGIAIEVGLSIGIAFVPDHAGDADEAMRHADIAMYAAKRRSLAYEFYAREDDQHSVRRLSMVSDLRSAIANSEIELLYQPQIDLRSGALVGAEALLRWQHPVHGSVSPEEFIAIAESTDLIQPLTEWAINESLRQAVCWQQDGLAVRVAVNLSARSLQHVDFPQQIELMLARFGLDARWLELEITETAMMQDPQRALGIVRDLQALGVRVAIDDFGTGYSSLGYLRDLRVNALKLDKSFVIDLENRQQNRVIVESTAQMGEALGFEVVAEGIETAWVSDYLCRAGYLIGQGYWFGKPAPADEIIRRFRQPAAQAMTG